MRKVLVVIGPGQIGQAIARRVGAGKHVLLADLRQENANAASEVLANAGNEVSVATVDVSSREAVQALVETATRLGEVTGLIHAAGVSPSQATPATILKVDLYGTALVLEAFGNVIARGGILNGKSQMGNGKNLAICSLPCAIPIRPGFFSRLPSDHVAASRSRKGSGTIEPVNLEPVNLELVNLEPGEPRIPPLVIQAPHGQVDGSSRHPARPIGSHEGCHARHLGERHQPSRVGPACEQLLPLFPCHSRCLGARLEGILDRACLRHALWPQTDHASAMRCELGG
jgi:short chain dehydrogenase